MSYERLKGLKAEDFEHPGEKAAMAVLRKIPILDMVMAKYLDMQTQLNLYAETAGSNFRITEKTNPRIYNLYKLALARLDMPKEYPLYCKWGYEYNAFTAGVDDPFIVINSSSIDFCTDEEILQSIGHELGHIKCGHLLYYSIANSINSILAGLGGVGTAAALGLQYAIMDWQRNAEYSADRAGLIASGSIEGTSGRIMKLLGRSDEIPDIDFSVQEAMKQADDFDLETSDAIGKMLYIALTAKTTHPWAILRLKQINEWYNSGEYEKVITKFT